MIDLGTVPLTLGFKISFNNEYNGLKHILKGLTYDFDRIDNRFLYLISGSIMDWGDGRLVLSSFL